MAPLIGIFTSERHAPKPALADADVAPSPRMFLGLTYLRAIEAAGGLPVVLAPADAGAAAALLDRLDGLVLAGGPDLDPLAYGDRERHERLGPTDRELDAVELALVRAAEDRALPLLGICRGLQAINVARGGTLHQHVDGHQQPARAHEAHHVARVAPGSLLSELTGGGGALEVNSFHHQATGRVGAGLRPVAWAADGTVEALEDPAARFLLGVQWHAECMIERPEQLALFGALVEAAEAAPLRLAA